MSQIDAINEMPLYPTETLLWDENVIPTGAFYNESTLALPKLNLQFLTYDDYLLRNFQLYRLEATHQIRGTLVLELEKTSAKFALADAPDDELLLNLLQLVQAFNSIRTWTGCLGPAAALRFSIHCSLKLSRPHH